MLTTSRKSFDAIVSELHGYDLSDWETYEAYSGRGMYGKVCIGFTASNPTMILMALTAVLIGFEDDEQFDDIPHWSDLNVRQDNMGLDYIVYFPNWQLDTESDSE